MARDDMFGVVRRDGGISEDVARGLTREQADRLADDLQANSPHERFAVVELVFHRWTKPDRTAYAAARHAVTRALQED